MALTYWERKEYLPYGALTQVARAVPCTMAMASRVLSGKSRNRRIECLIARRLKDDLTGKRFSVVAAFGAEYRKPTLQPETEL